MFDIWTKDVWFEMSHDVSCLFDSDTFQLHQCLNVVKRTHVSVHLAGPVFIKPIVACCGLYEHSDLCVCV